MLLKCRIPALSLLLLIGCEQSTKSIGGICDSAPQLCEDIQTEGWCRAERATLIRQRFVDSQNPENEDNQYRMLLSWAQFRDCVNLASQVTHIKDTDKPTTRTKAYLTAVNELARLEDRLRHSHYPLTMFYRYAQHGSEEDIKTLLKLDAEGRLKTTELQLKMASYYTKYNKRKAVMAHHKAFDYLTEEQTIPYAVYASLATYYFQSQQYQLAYVWSFLAHEHDIKAVDLKELQDTMQADDDEISQLIDIAEEVMDSIEERQFVRPRILLDAL